MFHPQQPQTNNSQNISSNVIDTFYRDDFQLVKPMPSDSSSYMREIRFNMNYCQANRLNQTAKW